MSSHTQSHHSSHRLSICTGVSVALILVIISACSVYSSGPFGDSLATVESAQATGTAAAVSATQVGQAQATQWEAIYLTQTTVYEDDFAPTESLRRQTEELLATIMVVALGMIVLISATIALVRFFRLRSKTRNIRQEAAERRAEAHAIWSHVHRDEPTHLPR